MGVRSAAVNLGTGLFPVLATKVAGEGLRQSSPEDHYHSILYLSVCGVVGALLLVMLLVKKR